MKMPVIDDERIVRAIGAAERLTSGEVRVYISRAAASEPMEAARKQFEQLGMTKTAERNGVLIFVAPKSQTFAVIGDTAIHAKCGESFWTELAAAMTTCFRRGDFTAGLVLGIEKAGALLQTHFPRQPDDRNELPDAIVRG